ncbi:MAG: hypothetical protein IPJ76_13815 [Flavobacteriales bacterium]|nr:MAG: hypothetical protein IPJ76_13815 [Flavobacteriales bacterium]
MTSIELRSSIHKLVDSIKSEEMLKRIHELLASSGESGAQGVWQMLTDAQRERVLAAYTSSLDPNNLSTTDEVMKRRKA